jgi:sec-independent protein translocase protein TatA
MLNPAYFTAGYDWLIIAGIAVLLFGGTKLPQLAKGLGEGIREFKKSVSHDEPDPTTPPPGPAATTEKTTETTTVVTK